jgi:amino-acid N-acetyltransferase
MTTALLRTARDSDAAAIRALLEGGGLPTEDLPRSGAEFVVACAGTTVIGTGGLQRCGASGLLRSVVVSESWRGTGVGRAIVERLEQHARALGLEELVLLTQTAATFFERQGYQRIARHSAPAAVQASEEFRLLCPQSAACLRKSLRAPHLGMSPPG